MRPGDRFIDRFEIEHLAGEGGAGAVWRAFDRETGQTVALKLLLRQNAEQARRFAREAEVLQALAHPGIVRHVGHGISDDGRMWLAMEWLDGEDLEDRLLRGPLSLPESLDLVGRVATIVGLAHARGIVHRDLKPRNLFLQNGDLALVKVLDFGIVRFVGSSDTATGVALGTPWYMAPEQARADRRLDARADVWALGCLLFECATGRTPFEGEQVMAILAKILLESPPRLSSLLGGIPRDVDELVSRTLAKDPAARPADGAALAAEIADALSSGDDTLGRLSSPSIVLGDDEQRLVSVVLLGAPAASPHGLTMTSAEDEDAAVALAAAADPYGGRLERLADGSSVVALTGAGAATDQARRAARCALALGAVRSDVPVALATGLAEVSGRFPVGEAIDRAARIAQGASPGIWLDEITRGLLDARFTVHDEEGRSRLVSEEDADEGERAVRGRRVPLVGRDRELAMLEELFDECAEEPIARAVLVTAPPGAGKTRLRQELVQRIVARRPARVWIGRADPMSAGSPFGLLAHALRGALGIRDGDPQAVARRRLRARVERCVGEEELERVATFLGELVDVPVGSDDDPRLRAAREDAILMGDQMRRAWEDFVAAECKTQPLLLVLEDLHWGDLPTVAFVDAALRNLADRPLMVLALARPEAQELFPKLWEERRLQTLRLEELTRRASEKLVRALFGEEPVPERISVIVERGAGNPFFLEELVRAQIDAPGAAAPGTVLAMLHVRLDALAPNERRVLRAASIFGQVAWRGGVDALLGAEVARREIDNSLSALVTGEFLVKRAETRFPAEEAWCFRHALVRDAAYESLTAVDRATGHRLAADWLERAGERDALVLAEHLERGGERARAIDWYRRAADDALGGNDFALVQRCVGRARDCGAEGSALGALRLLEAQAAWWSGDYPRAESAALAAAELLPPTTSEACTAWAEGASAAASAGRLETVRRVAGALESHPVVDSNREAFVSASARVAVHALHSGWTEEADRLLGVIETQRPLRPAPLATVEARVHFAHALHRRLQGDIAGYLARCGDAVSGADQGGDLRYGAIQRVNVGFARLELGDNAEAEAVLGRALREGERLGLPIATAGARSNLGVALMRLGRSRESLECQERAVGEFERLGNRRLEGTSRLYLAGVLCALDEPARAEMEARRAATLLAAAPLLLPLSWAVLAQALQAQGRTGEASEAAHRGMILLEDRGKAPEGEAIVRVAHAEALARTGDVDGSRSAIRKAREILLARAEAIGDPAARAAFLSGVPANARTLELAREWLGEGGPR
ncbi:MAG: protein kinase [Deltaproteobacteria bacterium]|nr:protein kinase [Deltaproteobacteria bacterium]